MSIRNPLALIIAAILGLAPGCAPCPGSTSETLGSLNASVLIDLNGATLTGDTCFTDSNVKGTLNSTPVVVTNPGEASAGIAVIGDPENCPCDPLTVSYPTSSNGAASTLVLNDGSATWTVTVDHLGAHRSALIASGGTADGGVFQVGDTVQLQWAPSTDVLTDVSFAGGEPFADGGPTSTSGDGGEEHLGDGGAAASGDGGLDGVDFEDADVEFDLFQDLDGGPTPGTFSFVLTTCGDGPVIQGTLSLTLLPNIEVCDGPSQCITSQTVVTLPFDCQR